MSYATPLKKSYWYSETIVRAIPFSPSASSETDKRALTTFHHPNSQKPDSIKMPIFTILPKLTVNVKRKICIFPFFSILSDLLQLRRQQHI